jgi:hypothetical protein
VQIELAEEEDGIGGARGGGGVRDRVEGAVVALAAAEGDVEIEVHARGGVTDAIQLG